MRQRFTLALQRSAFRSFPRCIAWSSALRYCSTSILSKRLWRFIRRTISDLVRLFLFVRSDDCFVDAVVRWLQDFCLGSTALAVLGVFLAAGAVLLAWYAFLHSSLSLRTLLV